VSCVGGPGVDFTDLPPAVAAAAPGDEIWVYHSISSGCPGVNAKYTAPIIDKPLRIVGFRVGASAGTPGLPQVDVRGVVVAVGIPAGATLSLSDIAITHSPQSETTPAGIVALDCAGQILLEDVFYRASGFGNSYMRFERCNDVVMRGCTFYLGGHPIKLIDSKLLLTSTLVDDVAPNNSGWPVWMSYPATTEALRLIDSEATLIASIVRGGQFYNNPFGVPTSWVQRPGAIIENGLLRVGPFTTLSSGFIGVWPWYEAGYQILGNGTVEADSRASVNTFQVWPPILPVPQDLPSVYHSWAIASEPFQVSVAGPPNGVAVLAIGDWAPAPHTLPFGSLVIEPSTAIAVGLATLPAPDGWFEWTFTVPSAAPVAHPFALQAVTLDPAGVMELSAPSPLTVAWGPGQIP
jgi:hypothetical protein